MEKIILILSIFLVKLPTTHAFPPIIEPHPKDAEDMQRENDDYRYKDMRDLLDIVDSDRAPHSTDDAKNFAEVNK